MDKRNDFLSKVKLVNKLNVVKVMLWFVRVMEEPKAMEEPNLIIINYFYHIKCNFRLELKLFKDTKVCYLNYLNLGFNCLNLIVKV